MSSNLSLKLDNWVIERLSEPFPIEELNFRVGGGNTVLAYLDARQVIERLNGVIGAENWHDSYHPTTVTETEVKDVTSVAAVQSKISELGLDEKDVFWFKQGKITGLKDKSFAEYEYNDIKYGGMQCDLTILGVTKADVGSPSMADQLKGATSDALKRAAVKFGIGAYLYDLKGLKGRAEYGRVVETPQLPEWAYPVDRPNPDDIIKKIIAEARALEVENAVRENIELAISEVEVMGHYNPAAPLVVKRALYEYLTSVLQGA